MVTLETCEGFQGAVIPAELPSIIIFEKGYSLYRRCTHTREAKFYRLVSDGSLV
jgi:hypothetical protein